jgi:4-alpha-glucanotransferase
MQPCYGLHKYKLRLTELKTSADKDGCLRAGYNWERMAEDGDAWWRKRLSHMAQYFTAYRVDHILGFFRVYEVPARHVTGALGHFRPSQPLTRTQLQHLGLWDVERLCDPWIPDDMLREALQKEYEEVVSLYFEQCSDHSLRFRPQWQDERALATISVPSDSPVWLLQVRSSLSQKPWCMDASPCSIGQS